MDNRKWLFNEATLFLTQVYQELQKEDLSTRLSEVFDEILESGTYTHTFEELEFGAKLAWRNSNRCIGRIFYDSLTVFDYREKKTESEIKESLIDYMNFATNKGQIQASIAIYPPKHPEKKDEYRIWNSKLVRFAGYQEANAKVIGDPAELEFTALCESMGWQGKRMTFEVLPLILQLPGSAPILFELPDEVTKCVPIEHPEYDWFKELNLTWYAVPFISDMTLEIGGLFYTMAPFNGWFMETEIGSRNLGDVHRYNQLPTIANKMGLKTNSKSNLWRDRALVELNQAVYYSYKKSRVKIVDHHTASTQFMKFVERERIAGREVTGDWSWLVPPMSGSSTEVFHQEYENTVKRPNYFYTTPNWKNSQKGASKTSKCPFYLDSITPKPDL